MKKGLIISGIISLICFVLLSSCKTLSTTPKDIGASTPSITFTDSSIIIDGHVYSAVKIQPFLDDFKKGVPVNIGLLMLTLRRTDTDTPDLHYRLEIPTKK